jgi:hypothetical protein
LYAQLRLFRPTPLSSNLQKRKGDFAESPLAGELTSGRRHRCGTARAPP